MKTRILHDGWSRFAATAGALLFLNATPAHAAGLQPAGFTTTGSGVTTEVLSDLTTVVKFTAAGTITLDQDTTARILAVGGGGGGGGDCAPGGGGGGVIDRTGVTLRAGLYSVSVGSGGIGGSGTGVKGSNGGNTSLQRDGASDPMLLAYGGGGAGAWNNGAGLDGGCGGGGWSSPGQGVEGQGYPATAQEGDAPGGGGGAGGSPAAVNIGRGSSTQRQADGGPGRASDITGTTEYYGPGGGSGGFNGLGGWGGDQSTLATEGWIWGCGWSHSNAMTDEAMVAAGLKQQGRDGYGGGGGGSSNTHYPGGNGGSGVLILRIDPVQAAPEPKITVTVETTGPNPAVKVFVASVGADADTTGVFFQTALSAAGLDAAATNVATAAATPGQTVSIPLSSYPAGLTYFVRVVAKNDQNVCSTPSETTFRLPDLPVGAAAEGGDKVVQLSGASHDIVHTFTQSGTFTLSAPATVRYLVVGGGGAGGETRDNNSGGGGGAGGFLAGTTNLAAGTYTITVGAGGQVLGASGSPSSISDGADFAITALGGGGGGGGNQDGNAGASGGGGGSRNGTTNGGAGTSGQGFGGGMGGVGTNWVDGSYTETTGGRVTGLDTMSGGGGGAGGPGTEGNVDNHNTCNGTQYGGYLRYYRGGNGGPGLPSDITGEEVWYAGGGGGGTWHDETYVAWGGSGGKGGGGMGDWSILPQADIDGKPNSGGGGGGQGRGNGRNDPIYWGKGGSGVVILRYAPAGDAVGLEPVETALGATSATVTTWTAGAGVAEEVRWGTDPSDLSNTAAVSGGTATLSPLVPGTTYYAQAAGGGLAGKIVEFLARPWPRFYSDDAQPVMVGASDYLVTFTQGGAFTLPAPVTVRALLVGGGGGGGCSAGAGGGAGGMLEVSNVVLAAGSYTVRVGAGGAASGTPSATGSKGGDTVLLRDGEPVLRAYGGGGGQSWECYGEAALETSTGGSGGGSTRQDKPGTYIDPAQGNPGGPSVNYTTRGDWDGNPAAAAARAVAASRSSAGRKIPAATTATAVPAARATSPARAWSTRPAAARPTAATGATVRPAPAGARAPATASGRARPRSRATKTASRTRATAAAAA